jgi:hypothetical protein
MYNWGMQSPLAITTNDSAPMNICVVPFRMRNAALEFCIVSGHAENCWSFPVREVANGGPAKEAVVSTALSVFGLEGSRWSETPLDDMLLTGTGSCMFRTESIKLLSWPCWLTG